MSRQFPSIFSPHLLLLATALVAGCQTNPRPVEVSTTDVRTELRLESGQTGTSQTWAEFIDQATQADIIVLGEEHDDATGHAVQLAVVEEVLDRHNGGTLALEMLERDEQILVDDHADGILDASAFAKETRSTDWAGKGSWAAWYQPIIDAALDRGGRIIAANAPRRYVRLARLDGWEAIDGLPDQRNALVEFPPEPIEGVYRERFMEIMGGHEGDDGESPTEEAIAMADSFYLAQQVWDATMADSVASAFQKHGGPVILLVGRFHSDHEGGTVRELRRLLPGRDVLVVSLESNRGEALEAGQDVPQADVVIYTRPE